MFITLIVFIIILQIENKELYKIAEKQDELLVEATEILQRIYDEVEEKEKNKKEKKYELLSK